MAHANARLTQFGRLLLVQRITELGWPPAQAAESLGVSRATAYKWLARYRQHGQAGLADRSSRPYHCPHALSAAQVRRVLAARRRYRQGPHRLAFRLHMARSTIYGVLARHHMSRLAHTDRASGVVVRYQRQHPGELVHLDVKKLGRIPDGGGHRAHGRAAARPGRGIGYDYLHSTAGPDRQRQGLCRVGPVHRDRRHPWDPAQAHATVSAPDQRQGRVVQQDPARGVGLRPAVPQQHRAPAAPSPAGYGLTITGDHTPHSTA
jgi:transposase